MHPRSTQELEDSKTKLCNDSDSKIVHKVFRPNHEDTDETENRHPAGPQISSTPMHQDSTQELEDWQSKLCNDEKIVHKVFGPRRCTTKDANHEGTDETTAQSRYEQNFRRLGGGDCRRHRTRWKIRVTMTAVLRIRESSRVRSSRDQQVSGMTANWHNRANSNVESQFEHRK